MQQAPIPRRLDRCRNAGHSGSQLCGAPASTSAALPKESPPLKESHPIHRTQQLLGSALRNTQGELLIPAKFEGADGYFKFEPSSGISAITAAASDSVHLRRTSVSQDFYLLLGGQRVKERVRTGLKFGHVLVRTSLLLSYGPLSTDTRIVGIVGADVLEALDVELDLAHGKVNLFSQNHCPGNAAYWAHNVPTSVIPLMEHGSGPAFDTELDGHELETQLAPSAERGRLNSIIATKEFGIDGDLHDSSVASRHTFKSLNADGISISSPTLDIYQASAVCTGRASYVKNTSVNLQYKCYGAAPLYLGYFELKELRMYFAFGERKLYVTAANAGAGAASAEPPSPTATNANPPAGSH